MSAWLLNSKQMTRIRDKIVLDEMEQGKYENEALVNANEVVMSWNKMNRYAILCRYEERNKPVKLDKFDANNVCSDVQFYKSLCCLQYQCSEGDTDTRHKKAWKLLEHYIGETAQKVVLTHPDYANAEWG